MQLLDGVKMNTWLFTWNVDRWPWSDSFTGYRELKNDIKQIGYSYCKWTCGNNKSIEAGDRIFLIKLGSKPRGIVASGYAASNVFEGTHWDIDKVKEGKKARRVFVKFDAIRDYENEPILDMEKLIELNKEYRWSSQSSGIRIPEEISVKLEGLWKNLSW